MSRNGRATVLVVDDEATVADAYAAQLGGEYHVETVYSGEAAVDAVHEDVDVMLLDRRMPDASGSEVLTAVRERGFDCRVAMVTAVEPDFDIVDMPFDDYVVKPASTAVLREAIDRLCRCADYEALFRRYYALTTKYVALKESKPASVLDESEEFDRLATEVQSVRADLEALTDELGEAAYQTLFATVEEVPSG